MNLAKYLIAAANDKGVLKDRILPEKVDKYRLCALLTRISQLVVDQPDISAMELNPILASNGQFLVLDATISVNRYQARSDRKRLCIRPYPIDLVEEVTLKNNTRATLRPIRPEDEKAHQEFDQSLNKEDRYKRFFGELPQFNHDQLAKMTQIDYDREMAFIVCQRFEGKSRTLGVARVIMDPDNLHAEFATVVRSDYQGLGLGRLLMSAAINHCKRQGVEVIEGITLPENTGMIELARKLGLQVFEGTGNYRKAGHILDTALIALIMLNVIAIVLESVPSINKVYYPQFLLLEVISVAIFSLEYLARLWACVDKSKYAAIKGSNAKRRLHYFLSRLIVKPNLRASSIMPGFSGSVMPSITSTPWRLQ